MTWLQSGQGSHPALPRSRLDQGVYRLRAIAFMQDRSACNLARQTTLLGHYQYPTAVRVAITPAAKFPSRPNRPTWLLNSDIWQSRQVANRITFRSIRLSESNQYGQDDQYVVETQPVVVQATNVTKMMNMSGLPDMPSEEFSVPFQHFALLYVDDAGTVRFRASPSIRSRGKQSFSQLREEFLNAVYSDMPHHQGTFGCEYLKVTVTVI